MLTMNDSRDLLLGIMSSVLFGCDLPPLNSVDWEDLYNEAKMQAVFLQVYNRIMPYLPETEAPTWEKGAMKIYAHNLEIAREHGSLHKIMTGHSIPYVAIKGLASAKYYPEPLYRVLGDVDFVIEPDRMEEACELILGLGYTLFGANTADPEKDMEFHGMQGSHHVVWELHPQMNSLPSGRTGDVVKDYLSDLIKTGREYVVDEDKCMIPNEKHHCLILLIHMAGHLTKEGIGIRHLCDWAAFIDHISDEEFCGEYKEMLQKCGLYRFAQVITHACEKYLGLPGRSWSGKADSQLVDALMEDMLNSGNFGFKDRSRYQQIKYLRSVDYAVDTTNPLRQALHSIHVKAKDHHPLLMKVFITYPLGWGAVAMDYVIKLAAGSRKRKNPLSTIKEAGNRNRIYEALNLYETEEAEVK